MNTPRSFRQLVLSLVLLAPSGSLTSCGNDTQAWPDAEWTGFEAGAPLPGLAEAEWARWEEGYTQFFRIWTEEEGLGPAFNENSCNACHSDPTVGGTMTESVPPGADPILENAMSRIFLPLQYQTRRIT